MGRRVRGQGTAVSPKQHSVVRLAQQSDEVQRGLIQASSRAGMRGNASYLLQRGSGDWRVDHTACEVKAAAVTAAGA